VPQHLKRGIPVDQFAALGLGKARIDMSGYRVALFDHPVFELKLLADYLEGLIQDLVRVLICAGPDGQVNHALLLRFQINRHEASCFERSLAALT
jgi:hypothetical protein